MKGCITFVILITFSLGFPKRVKVITSVLVVREETYTYMKPLGKFSMQNTRNLYCAERMLINAQDAF